MQENYIPRFPEKVEEYFLTLDIFEQISCLRGLGIEFFCCEPLAILAFRQ